MSRESGNREHDGALSSDTQKIDTCYTSTRITQTVTYRIDHHAK